MTAILAAVARDPNEPFTIEKLTLGPLRDDEVLVKIHSTGICHSDILAKQQLLPFKLPAVLGHEGAGVIEQVGASVKKVTAGDHVIVTFDYCGHCKQCLSGHPAYCVELLPRLFSGARMDGSSTMATEGITASFFAQSSFATHSIATERNVVKVPADLDLSILGQLGCGIQTGAGAVLNRIRPEAGSTLLVCGVGPVGAAAVMAGRAAGCTKVVALDIKDNRLALAKNLGATHVVNGTSADVAEQLSAIVPGGFDGAVDTTARQSVVTTAFSKLATRGILVLLGAGGDHALSFSTHELIAGGRTVCGVSEGDSAPDVFIPRLIELYRAGLFPIDQLVQRYELSEINAACAAAHAGDVMKPVLIMPHEH